MAHKDIRICIWPTATNS